MGWGGAPEFIITLTNCVIWAKDFLHVPFYFTKDSWNIDDPKFFAPPPRAHLKFSPSLATHPKILPPPFHLRFKKTLKPIKHLITLNLYHLKKQVKPEIFRPPFAKRSKFFAPPFRTRPKFSTPLLRHIQNFSPPSPRNCLPIPHPVNNVYSLSSLQLD